MAARRRSQVLNDEPRRSVVRGVSSMLGFKGLNQSTNFFRKILLKTGMKDRAFLGAFYVAVPNAIITLTLRLLATERKLPYFYDAGDEEGVPKLLNVHSAVWTGIVGGLSFLVVFRASQAYTRFWKAITAVHELQAEWVEGYGIILASCDKSSEMLGKTKQFKHLLVRLFSLYHVAALLSLVEPGIDDAAITNIAALDPMGFDDDSLDAFRQSPHRFELMRQWLYVALMQGVEDKVLTAPAALLARAFQKLAGGNARFEDSRQVKEVPFPVNYQLICDALLVMHWCITPFLTTLWVNSPAFASLFSFCSVFVFWSLTLVSRSIENPFNTSAFIHEAVDMQDDMNSQLLMYLKPFTLVPPGVRKLSDPEEEEGECILKEATLGDIWLETQQPGEVSETVTQAMRQSRSPSNEVGIAAMVDAGVGHIGRVCGAVDTPFAVSSDRNLDEGHSPESKRRHSASLGEPAKERFSTTRRINKDSTTGEPANVESCSVESMGRSEERSVHSWVDSDRKPRQPRRDSSNPSALANAVDRPLRSATGGLVIDI